MIKADIDGIFQTPIYRTQLTQDFSKKQLSFIDKMKLQSQNDKKTRNKSGNITSSNKNILDKPVFKNLKQEIDLIIEDYFEKIYGLKGLHNLQKTIKKSITSTDILDAKELKYYSLQNFWRIND